MKSSYDVLSIKHKNKYFFKTYLYCTALLKSSRGASVIYLTHKYTSICVICNDIVATCIGFTIRV